MKEILHNIAHLDALNYCKENNIDPSGTHLIKYPRTFTYALIKYEDDRAILTTTFYKNRTPFRSIGKPLTTTTITDNDIINIDDIPF